MAERQVLWASTAGPGGVHDLLLAVQQTPLWTEWNMRHIVTHRAGGTARKLLVFACGTAQFTAALRSRPALVHLHAVDKCGSRLRSAVLTWLSRLYRVPVLRDVHRVDSSFDTDAVDWRELDRRYRATAPLETP
jgi:hypothetical protein